MLLRVRADEEGGDVHKLAADADVALADEDAGVVDRLGKALLQDAGLEAALEELLGGELEHVIQLLLVRADETVADHAAQEGGALEEAARVRLLQGQQLTGSLRARARGPGP